MTFAVDVGKIKIQWRNDYNAATSYEADDAVYFGGSSWICTVPPNLDGTPGQSTGVEPSVSSPNWDKMAQGADLSTMLVNTGDMVYFDGTDIQALPNGNTYQTLRIGTDGNPEWVYQGVLQTTGTGGNPSWSFGNSSLNVIPDTTFTMTTRGVNSTYLVYGYYQVDDTNSNSFGAGIGFQYSFDGGTTWSDAHYPDQHSDYNSGSSDTYKMIQRQIRFPTTWDANVPVTWRVTARFNNSNARSFQGNGGSPKNTVEIIVTEVGEG